MKHYCVVWWLIVLNVCVAGIDGLVDMKHIYGIIVVRRKGRRGKEDKVSEKPWKSWNYYFVFGFLKYYFLANAY